jgi:single-stranded-DNA-specific exonuclease
VSEDDIAFVIAPKINLASRMGHANTSYALLTTSSSEEADWITRHLEGLNKDRRLAVDKILKQVDAKLAGLGEKPEVIVEGDPGWVMGVLGLTASRIMEKYHCPVFLWGQTSGGKELLVKGSARAENVNLVDLMNALPKDLLLEFGGHARSAGFSLERDRVGEFKAELLKAFRAVKRPEQEDVLWLDKELDLGEVDWDLLETVEKFRPFGAGNPPPLFLFRDLPVFNVKMFGNGGIHLRLDFKGKDGLISAIGFFMPNGDLNIKQGDKIDLAASIERNIYNGNNELRLRIVDLRVK